MQSKISFRGSLLLVSILGITCSLVPIFFWISNLPASGYSSALPISPVSIQTPEPLVSGLPLRLKISKLNVDAPVQYVGVTPEGIMDVSKGPDDVAWYDRGPRPGEQGSAVIAGHYGVWKNGDVSVFNKLHTLVSGDIVSVEDDTGNTHSFVVRESRLYKKDADTSEVFLSRDGKSHLNFITCVWDKVSKTYAQRLVVFTDRQIN